MQFPEYRARRLRKNENFRRLIRETKLSVDDLVYPLFAVPGKDFKKPISSMPRLPARRCGFSPASRRRRGWYAPP